MALGDRPARAGSGVERALTVIELLVAARQSMTMTGIAEAAGLDTSSAHRILKVLTETRYVLRDPRSKRYLPGPKALYPLGLFHPLNEFRRDAVPIMRSLAQDTGHTVAVLAFVYGERVVLDIVHGSERLTPFYKTHLQRPLHSSASGKALLLSLASAQRAEALGPEPYASLTPSTIRRADQIDAELVEAERCGFTRSRDEDYAGISAVCAPIRSMDSTILGCFAAFGLSSKLPPERLVELGDTVNKAARLITHMSTSLEAIEIMVSQP